MKYFPGIPAYRNLIFAAFTLWGTAATAQTMDTGDWLNIPVQAAEVVALPGNDLLILDGSGTPFRLDTTSTDSPAKLPGNFTRLARARTGLPWALSSQGKLFFLRNSVWRQIETDIKIDNFSMGEKSIFIISEGKIREFTLLGEAVPNDALDKYSGVTSFFQINDKTFVLHLKSGDVLISKEGKEKILDKNIDKILAVENDFISTKNNLGDVFFHIRAAGASSKKIAAINSAGISSISVGEGGTLWAVGELGIYRAPFSLGELEGGRDRRAHKRKLGFDKIKAAGLRLFAGQDGVFRLTTTGGLTLWSPRKRAFIPFPGRVTELAVPGNGELWGINALGRIFHFEDEKWRQRRGLAVSISARLGDVLIVDNNGTVKRYDRKKKSFLSTKFREVEKAYVQNPRVFWLLKQRGKIFRCNLNRCKRVSGKARGLAISPEGVVFALFPKGKLTRFDGKRFVELKTPAKKVRDVAAWLNGTPWILDEKNMVHVARDKKSPLADFKDREAFEVGSKPGRTLGRGRALLGRFELMLARLKRSADAPNSGFTFRKKIKLKKITNAIYFLDLSMGRDGRLWALTNANVYQYHERDQAFKQYTSANFTSKEQEFLPLPNGITISSIISDSEDKIWAVRNASKQVYYQDKRKGTFRSTIVRKAPTNITDITVDLAGTVYVAAERIYRKFRKKNRFHLLSEGKWPFKRLSAGPAGTLWAVNSKRRVFELINGRMVKRPRKKAKFIGGQDVDISVEGTVYVTSRTHISMTNEPGFGVTWAAQPAGGQRCFLKKWNPRNRSLVLVGKNKRSQYVAVARDGTPWVVCAPSGNRNVFHGDNR